MTLRQFAKMIGYSPSTVSKAFSSAKDVREETRKSIIKAAEELGVLENFYKRPKTTKTVAIIVPEFNSGLYLKMITALSDCLKTYGAVTTISETDFSNKRADDLISYYSSEQRADGIIVLGYSGIAKKYSVVPIMYYGKRNDPFADSIYIDSFTGICEVILNFKLFGHTRIAFIGETHTQEKENAFRNAMRFYGIGINEEYVIKSELRHEEAGYESMKKLLSLPIPPTAVLAAYDDIAAGAMQYAKEKGLSAPKHYSIAGMDNSQLSSNGNIMLSSVDYHDKEICDLLVSRLMKKIENPNYCVNQRTEIKSSLVLRNSIGHCPQ